MGIDTNLFLLWTTGADWGRGRELIDSLSVDALMRIDEEALEMLGIEAYGGKIDPDEIPFLQTRLRKDLDEVAAWFDPEQEIGRSRYNKLGREQIGDATVVTGFHYEGWEGFDGSLKRLQLAGVLEAAGVRLRDFGIIDSLSARRLR